MLEKNLCLFYLQAGAFESVVPAEGTQCPCVCLNKARPGPSVQPRDSTRGWGSSPASTTPQQAQATLRWEEFWKEFHLFLINFYYLFIFLHKQEG